MASDDNDITFGAGDLAARILSHAAEAIVVTGPDDRVRYWNDAAEKMFGWPRAEALGARLAELVLPGAGESAPAAESVPGTEAIRRCRDGTLIAVHYAARPLPGADGGCDGHVHSHSDVTHLKVRRDARVIEARFRNLLESTPDAIVIVNDIGRIVFCNEQAEALFGWPRDELVGGPLERLMPQRYRGAHVGHRSDYLARGLPRTRPMGLGLELYGVRRNGEEFPVEISLSPLETEVGRMGMSAIRDMTARRKAEQKFRGLLESAPDAIVIVDGRGQMVLVNTQTERLFGYPRAELLGQPVEILVPEQFRGGHGAKRGAYFAGPNVRPMGAGLQLYGRRRDGSQFPVEISLSPLETEEGRLVSASIRDITERRQVERALQEQNVQLERANLAKDRFLASMSHELRTPLNAIIGFTGLMLMRLPGPITTEQEKQLGLVQSSAKHLLSLINDLLDLAKIDSGSVEMHLVDVPCRAIVEEVAATLRPAAEAKGLALDAELPDGEVVLRTDRRALQQILLNLATNAVKFTEQGRVSLAIRRERGRGEVAFDVVDTGVGISSDDQARLFQPFTQLAGPVRGEGTGLGLHLCRKLAELLGGRIELVSAPAQGSRFSLVVPSVAGVPG